MTDATLASALRLGSPHTAAARLRGATPTVAVTLGVFLLLVLTSSQLLNDPDTQWHVATGRWIWSHRSFPTSDVFSHTFAGAPWIAKEWGAQLILFAAHAADGWRGVALVAAAALAVSYGMLFGWLARRLRMSVALAMTLTALMLGAPHLLARPHALVLPFVVLWMTRLIASLERREAPPLRLALAMVAWANMHGSFPLGLAVAGLMAAEGVLMRSTASRIVALRRWGVFLAVSTIATLVTPYGWQAVLIPLQIGSNAAVPFLSEWRPLTFDAGGGLALGLFTLSLLVLALDAKANAFRIVAVLALGGLMIRHSRFVDLFGIIDPVLIAGPLATRLRLLPDQGTRLGPASLFAPVSAIAVLALAAGISMTIVVPRPNPSVAPEAALRAALERGVAGPVYNDYDFGGFLIAHGIKTFVDGRSDQLFLGDFLPRLQQALDAKDDRRFAAILAQHQVRWALVKSKSQDATHLAALPGWTKLFDDDAAAVFTAPSDRKSR